MRARTLAGVAGGRRRAGPASRHDEPSSKVISLSFLVDSESRSSPHVSA